MNLNNDKTTYSRLLVYLKPYKKHFIIGLFASVPASALNGAVAFAIGPLIDKLLRTQDYSVLLYIPLLIIIVSLIQGAFDYISEYYTNRVGYAVSQDVRQELFYHLTEMDVGFFKNNTSGNLFTRFYTDTMLLQQAIVANLQGFIIQFCSMVFLAGVLFYRNWQFALMAILIISLMVIPLHFISKKIRQLDYQIREVSAGIINVFHELINGIKEVKVFQLGLYQRKRFNKALNEYMSTAIRAVKAGSLLSPFLQLITALGLSLVFLLGALEVIHGKMTPGDLTSFVLALILLYKPVKVIGGIIGKIQRILAPAERVFDILDKNPKLLEVENPKRIEQFESLVFENVSFSYAPDKPVLRDINLEVKAGEVIALVGGSGGGKTTLSELIPRFLDPTEGRILMNGIDLRELSFESLRRLIATVSQETMLFNGTVAENVALGRMGSSEQEVARAIQDAQLEDWLNTLPDGAESIVGERGNLVSVGQKQRVAIARAYLKKAPILILDEATSALDNETEAKIQKVLWNLMKDRTVLIIAHRLSTIRQANRIIVMDKGRIVEQGTHQELLEKDGVYNRLYRLQFTHEEILVPSLKDTAQA